MSGAEPRRGVLITRPAAEAGPLAELVRSRGLEPVTAPLLAIRETGAELPIEGVQAVLLTSANGARALGHATQRRDLAILAVGDATAGTARVAGFGNVAVAGGDVESLAALAREACDPAAGPLLHVSGRDIAGNLAGTLEAAGFTVRRAVLYHAEAAETLPETARDALAAGRVGAALFFSPRTAQSFVILAEQAGVGVACRAVSAICLSRAVADAASGLDWAQIRVADRPDLDALLACLDDWASGQSPENRVTETPKDDKTPEPRPAAPAGSGSPPRTRGGKAAWLLTGVLIVLVAAVGSYISWPLWRDSVPGWARAGLAPMMEAGRAAPAPTPAPIARLDGLEAQLQAAQDEIAALKEQGAPRLPPTAETPQLAALARETERLAGEIGQLRAAEQPLSGRIDALEERLAAVAQAPDGEPAAREAADALAQTEARIDALERRLEAAAQAAAESAAAAEALAEANARLSALQEENRTLTEALDGLRQRLDDVAARAGERAAAGAGAALLVAVGDLRIAVRSGRPYAETLAALRAVAPKEPAVDAALDTLARHAEAGVATPESLRRRFAPMAAEAARAGRAPEGAGWLDQTVARLSGLVTVRRTGERAAAEDTVDGRLARAELRLDDGDLAGAVAALEGLSGAPAEATADWLAAARARIEAEHALAAVNAEAIRRTGGAEGKTAG